MNLKRLEEIKEGVSSAVENALNEKEALRDAWENIDGYIDGGLNDDEVELANDLFDEYVDEYKSEQLPLEVKRLISDVYDWMGSGGNLYEGAFHKLNDASQDDWRCIVRRARELVNKHKL